MTGLLRALALCAAVLLAGPAPAQTASVAAGEHEGFTRIVITAPAIGSWQVGRTAEGYGLLLDPARPFDLTAVFRLIGRTRLSAIWPDPQGGMLRLKVACDCHAIAFLDNPGVLVLDLKDGPAPDGSVFEAALVPGDLPALRRFTPVRPRERPPQLAIRGPAWARVVWQASRVETLEVIATPTGTAPSDDLLAALTAELARGAARGLVDFASPEGQDPAGLPVTGLPPGLDARLSGLPGMAVIVSPDSLPGMTAAGSACLEDERIAIVGWADDRPAWEQLAEATALPGEFDQPDPDRRAKAVRLLLNLGFGLEARRLIEAMPVWPEAAENDPYYLAMADILDGETAGSRAFDGQGSCDGSVAMWALLEDPDQGGASLNTAAVRRGFSALPLHLRRLLGPRLVDRFLARNDPASAADVQAAMQRAGSPLPAEVTASAAELSLQAGDPAAALEAVAEAPATGPGSVDLLLAEVEASVRLAKPLPAETSESLAALLVEYRDGPDAPALARALVLAQAASGQFGPALDGLSETPDTAEPVWAMLSRADDETMILHAVGPAGDELAGISDQTKRALAERLIDLGLGEPALAWLGDPPLDATLGAKAALLAGDARGTLRLLAGADDEAAVALRQAALAQLYAPGSDLPPMPPPADPRLAARTGDWQRVAAEGDGAWQAVAALVTGPDAPPATGLIGQGNAALDLAQATAAAIAELRTATE